MPDGRMQEPGGWNRFSVEVPDLAATVTELRSRGARFRNDIVTGTGGKQIIIEDPSGNPVELFQPILPEARMTHPTALRRSGTSSGHRSESQHCSSERAELGRCRDLRRLPGRRPLLLRPIGARFPDWVRIDGDLLDAERLQHLRQRLAGEANPLLRRSHCGIRSSRTSTQNRPCCARAVIHGSTGRSRACRPAPGSRSRCNGDPSAGPARPPSATRWASRPTGDRKSVV